MGEKKAVSNDKALELSHNGPKPIENVIRMADTAKPAVSPPPPKKK